MEWMQTQLRSVPTLRPKQSEYQTLSLQHELLQGVHPSPRGGVTAQFAASSVFGTFEEAFQGLTLGIFGCWVLHSDIVGHWKFFEFLWCPMMVDNFLPNSVRLGILPRLFVLEMVPWMEFLTTFALDWFSGFLFHLHLRSWLDYSKPSI